MSFVMKNGILVPIEQLPHVLTFVDETYLLNKSGFIQSAIPVPQNIYDDQLVPRCRDLLKNLGKDAAEFKAKNIKKGNKEVYRQFLEAFVGATSAVSAQYPLSPIVAVDGFGPYSDANFTWVKQQVVGGLSNLGIAGQEQLAGEFTRQVLWLNAHLPKLASVRFANEFVMTFDNKHRYAQETNKVLVVTHPDIIVPIFRPLGKNLTSFANTLLDKLTKGNSPKIASFNFDFSEKSFGLQAADMFSHLTYAALRCEMNIEEDKDDFEKYDLLLEVTEDFNLAKQLRSELVVAKSNEGRDDVGCNNPSLLSTYSFSCA
ncbi:MAG: hypothetical protein ACKVP0_11035 [Pirellulaceae bacterium]